MIQLPERILVPATVKGDAIADETGRVVVAVQVNTPEPPTNAEIRITISHVDRCGPLADLLDQLRAGKTVQLVVRERLVEKVRVGRVDYTPKAPDQ